VKLLCYTGQCSDYATGRAGIISLCHRVQTALGPAQPRIQWVLGFFPPD